MAVKGEFESITDFEDWYANYGVDERNGTLRVNGPTDCAAKILRRYDYFKREADARLSHYWKYEKMAARL